jgi:hypothetical protein
MFGSIKAALIVAALTWSVNPLAGRSDPTSAARRCAQQLQDDARTLRNGARAGRSAAVLAREHDRLRSDLDALVRSHERWVSALSAAEADRLAATIAEIEQGCARIRAGLSELDETLSTPDFNRRRVQLLGQSIGRQAWACERALRGTP